MAVLMIPAVHKYWKQTKIKNKFLFWITITFTMDIFIAHILWVLASLFTCNNLTLYHLMLNMWLQLFVLQKLLWLALLFKRLDFIFIASPFKLSSRTLRLFWISYFTLIIIGIASAVGYGNYYDSVATLILLLIASMMGIGLTLSVMYLFIYKLIAVYKMTNRDPELLTMITRDSLLSFIEIIMTIIFMTSIVLSSGTESIHVDLIIDVLASIDLFTSFWGVILGYQAFNDWYLKLFGCCDGKCKSCCNAIITGKDENVIVEMSAMS